MYVVGITVTHKHFMYVLSTQIRGSLYKWFNSRINSPHCPEQQQQLYDFPWQCWNKISNQRCLGDLKTQEKGSCLSSVPRQCPNWGTTTEPEKLSYSILCFSLLGHIFYLYLHHLFCFCLLIGSSGFCPRNNLKIYSMYLKKGIFSAASSEIEKLIRNNSLFLCFWFILIIRLWGNQHCFALERCVYTMNCNYDKRQLCRLERFLDRLHCTDLPQVFLEMLQEELDDVRFQFFTK